MSHSELDTDFPKENSSEELASVEEDASPISEDQHPTRQVVFTRWREESLPARAISKVGHRHIVKSRDVLRCEPVKIAYDITLEPDPEPESVEITPLVEGDAIVGLLLTCGCGATHEVRFDYGEEQ